MRSFVERDSYRIAFIHPFSMRVGMVVGGGYFDSVVVEMERFDAEEVQAIDGRGVEVVL